MKFVHTILLAAALTAGQLHALDSAQLAAVAKKFAGGSGDEQYKARVELNKLIDQATAPGKGDPAAVTKTLIAAVESSDTPKEAKKYILRALAKVGTDDAVGPMAKLLAGSDPLLKEEARQVLALIPGAKSIGVLEAALRKATDKRDKLSLVNALAMQKATQSIPAILPLLVDADAEIARAGVTALARIGGQDAVSGLQRAAASSKVSAATKADIEKAILVAGLSDPRTAAKIFASTKSEAVRMAAFNAVLTSNQPEAIARTIGTALKSDDDSLRQAALLAGLKFNLPSLQKGLAQSMDQLPKSDRLVVLSAIHFVKPAEAAEKIALSSVQSDDEDERVAALTALGRIATKPAFGAVLQAVGAREPRVNQAAGNALAQMDYAGAEAALLEMLKGSSSEQKILAVKAVAHRRVADVNSILVGILKGDDEGAAREAMKTLYFLAGLDDLRALCDAAKATTDAKQRGMLASVCTRIAQRLNTDEAKKLVEGLK